MEKKLGELIARVRKEKGLSRLKLGEKCGISHTEIARIENGGRAAPSTAHLFAIADALELPRDKLLCAAGCGDGEKTALERAFPALKTEKQKETAEKIVHGICRGGSLKEEDLDELYRQVECFIRERTKKE